MHRLLAVLTLLFSAGFVAVAATPPAGAPLLSLPAPVIADPANNPDWQELFRALAVPKARVSRFEERRFFPFRQEAVVLQGEIRISPEHGLSLHYLEPKPQTVIVDKRGVLMRDAKGRQREAPSDSRAQAATSGLFHVLRFDWPELARQFEVHGARDADGWTLGFVPRDSKMAGVIGSVVVRGTETRVQQIDMIRSDKQRIQILIQRTLEDVLFPADVLQEFFR